MSEQLNRLDDRLKSGELTEEQHSEEKRRLQEESISRSQRFWRKMGEAQRMKLELIRGTVQNMNLLDASCGTSKVTLDVDGRTVELSISDEPIKISVGDTVVLAATRKEPLRSHAYYNESTGSGSLAATRKSSRQLLRAGAAGMVMGLSILITVFLAAHREPAIFSTSGIFHVSLYLVAVATGGVVIALALGALALGALVRRTWKLVQSVVSGP